MTIRMLSADALKTGDPALCRGPLDHASVLARPLRRPRGQIGDPLTRDAEHLADWLAHVAAGSLHQATESDA